MAHEFKKPELTDPVAQDAKTVGDEGVEPREVGVEQVVESVPAQVAQPREADHDKVNVHESVFVTDEVITDPSSPLAVQVPDAGRGSLDLPAHALAAPTPEQVFAEASDESENEPEDEDPLTP